MFLLSFVSSNTVTTRSNFINGTNLTSGMLSQGNKAVHITFPNFVGIYDGIMYVI